MSSGDIFAWISEPDHRDTEEEALINWMKLIYRSWYIDIELLRTNLPSSAGFLRPCYFRKLRSVIRFHAASWHSAGCRLDCCTCTHVPTTTPQNSGTRMLVSLVSFANEASLVWCLWREALPYSACRDLTSIGRSRVRWERIEERKSVLVSLYFIGLRNISDNSLWFWGWCLGYGEVLIEP